MVERSGLRIVFFGTPAFAVPTLEALLGSDHRVVGVVTQPDRPRGRGHKVSYAPVKAAALQAGLSVVQPPTLKDPVFLATLRAFEADLGVVAAYGRILNDEVLAAPRLGMVNVHASLLPKYRGAAPVHRAVIAGEPETGVTIMRVVRALDAGPMLATVRRPIGPDETSEEVERDLAALGARLLVETIGRPGPGALHGIPQEEGLATYAPRLTKADGAIDWTAAAADIHNRVRGLHPWPHAFTFFGTARLILLKSATVVSAATSAPPATIVEAHGDDLTIATGEGLLRLLMLQAEGARPLPVRDFLAGHALPVGGRLTAAA